MARSGDDKGCFWYDLKVQPFARSDFANMDYADRSFFCFQARSHSSALRFPAYISSASRIKSFLEEQFPGAECGFDDRLDQRDAQLPFFEFEDAVNRAARRRRYRVFQQRWMVSRLQHHAR